MSRAHPLRFLFILCFAGAQPTLACVFSFASLAGVAPEQRADLVVEAYRTFLAAETAKPLTAEELAGLVANPFRLPALESGRASEEALLREFAAAHESLRETEHDPTVDRLRKIILSTIRTTHGERAAREAEQERERSTVRPITRPQATIVLPTGRLHTMTLLAGGKEVAYADGRIASFVEPESQWQTKPPPEPSMAYDVLPAQGWSLEWIRIAGNKKAPNWRPAGLTVPKTPPPLPAALLKKYPTMEGVLVSRDGKHAVATIDRTRLLVFPVGETTGEPLLKIENAERVLGLSADAKYIWVTSWIDMTRELALRYELSTGQARQLVIDAPQFSDLKPAPDEKTMFAIANSRFFEIDPEKNEVLQRRDIPAVSARRVELSSAGNYLIIFTPDAKTGKSAMELRDPRTHKLLGLARVDGEMQRISFSPDDKTLAIGYLPRRASNVSVVSVDVTDWLKTGQLLLEGTSP